MVRYAPFTSALCDKHSETRWTRHCLAIYHSGKSVKAGYYDSIIIDYNRAPFVYHVFVAGSLCGREISYDCLSPSEITGLTVPSPSYSAAFEFELTGVAQSIEHA